MWLKPLKFVPDNANYPFMKFARIGFIVSSILVVVSIFAYFYPGLNYGIDFKGGTLVEIRTQGPANLTDLRAKLSALDIGAVELQEFGRPDDVLIRLPAQAEEAAQQEMLAKVRGALGDSVDYRRTEVVGPKVSAELARDGLLAILASIVLVGIYLWFRFEWQFALGAIASLVHDVSLTIGLFVLLQVDFDLSIIAAILTIVGYSLNDTVVVYDRVRENLRRYKQMPLSDLIDRSLNETLPRTIMTSVSVFLALLALYSFGGEVIRGFTFAMLWGVVVGTYSSIYIAAPFLIFTGVTTSATQTDEQKQRAAAEAARP
jgi:preprotein translocase SecF subunit